MYRPNSKRSKLYFHVNEKAQTTFEDILQFQDYSYVTSTAMLCTFARDYNWNIFRFTSPNYSVEERKFAIFLFQNRKNLCVIRQGVREILALNQNSKELLLIPPFNSKFPADFDLRKELIWDAHIKTDNSHRSLSETTTLLTDLVVWPDMNSDIITTIQACYKCNNKKRHAMIKFILFVTYASMAFFIYKVAESINLTNKISYRTHSTN
jgi:hypothetical protein